jgi:hypothetical protein
MILYTIRFKIKGQQWKISNFSQIRVDPDPSFRGRIFIFIFVQTVNDERNGHHWGKSC